MKIDKSQKVGITEAGEINKTELLKVRRLY